MGNRAFDSSAKGLVGAAQPLQLGIGLGGRPAGGTLDTGERPFDPADCKDCAFIWHRASDSTPALRGKAGALRSPSG